VEIDTSNLVYRLIIANLSNGWSAPSASRDLFNFEGPNHIFETVEARNFKFGVQTDRSEYYHTY